MGGCGLGFQCAFLSFCLYDKCTEYRFYARYYARIYCDWHSCLFSVGHKLAQGAWHSISFVGVVIFVSKFSLANLLSLAFTTGDRLMLQACVVYSSYAVGLKLRPKVSNLVIMGYFAIAAFLTSIPLMFIAVAFSDANLSSAFG